MRVSRRVSLAVTGVVLLVALVVALRLMVRTETAGGWHKYEHNPVLGGPLGTCFDASVLKEGSIYRLWFSWRPRRSIALTESTDGIHWTEPVIVLGPNERSGWEEQVNRPVVLKRSNEYHMWYTGQARKNSWIGHAVSQDGKSWHRTSHQPVLSPDQPWEKVAVMCPHVLWDEQRQVYRMWYSAGEQYEPDSIGYATSPDGRRWSKWNRNPVFSAEPKNPWERAKVTGCYVVEHGGWYIMFYIGFRDDHRASIGIARSRDGISDWQRHSANPVIRRGRDTAWDGSAVYKPTVLLHDGRWLLWYNGRNRDREQIGLAWHEGQNLEF